MINVHIIRRQLLPLAAIAALAIATPQDAPIRDAGNNTVLRLAMGPMSAAQKNQNQGQQASSDTIGSATRSQHSTKHKHTAQ